MNREEPRTKLRAEESLQRVQIVTPGEVLKRLTREPVLEIFEQHCLQSGFQLLHGHAGEYLATERLLVAEAAADKNVIAFECLAGNFHLGAEQPDVANVMLRTGMRTAREMNVQRMIEVKFLFQVGRDLQRVTFRVG